MFVVCKETIETKLSEDWAGVFMILPPHDRRSGRNVSGLPSLDNIPDEFGITWAVEMKRNLAPREIPQKAIVF